MTLQRMLFTLAGMGILLVVAEVRSETFAQETTTANSGLPFPVIASGITSPHPPAFACSPTLEQLAGMNWCQLEQIYRQASAGHLPHGFGAGRVIYCPQKPFAGLSNKLASLWWRGKHFDICCGSLTNQWLIARAIRAKVYYGHSRFDGQPSILMDYADSAPRWREVRDEMREIAPGLYLGAMFLADAPQPKLWFVLQFHGK